MGDLQRRYGIRLRKFSSLNANYRRRCAKTAHCRVQCVWPAVSPHRRWDPLHCAWPRSDVPAHPGVLWKSSAAAACIAYLLILQLSTIYGTEWPIMCWCAAKKLPTHSLSLPLTARRPKLLHVSSAWLSLTVISSVSKTGGKSVVHDRLMFVSSLTITTAIDAFISDICRRAFANTSQQYRANGARVSQCYLIV